MYSRNLFRLLNPNLLLHLPILGPWLGSGSINGYGCPRMGSLMNKINTVAGILISTDIKTFTLGFIL